MLAFPTGAARACDMASQHRLLPLGASGERVVALELDQFRDREPSTRKLVWQVEPRLVYLAAGAAAVAIKSYARIEVSDADYAREMAAVLATAIADAKRLRKFRHAEVVSLTDCHYGSSCGDFGFSKRPGNELFARLGKRELAVAVRLPVRFLAHRNAFPTLDDEEFARLTPEGVARDHADLLADWSLGSVRLYRVGKRHIVAYNLGRGDTRYYRPTDKKLAPQSRKLAVRAGDFIYNEDLPHHGHAFDIVSLF